MRYEINVARRVEDGAGGFRYEHLFATHERSILYEHHAKLVYKELRARFPYPEFLIHVTRHENCGYGIDTSKWGSSHA